MKRSSFILRFHDLKFKNKLFLSYVIIGVLPFVIFCSFLYQRSVRSVEATVADGFHNLFQAKVDSIENRGSRIQNAMDMICLDETVANMATNSYENEYSKYLDIRVRFDAALQSMLLMNPEVTDYVLYVPNELSEIRGEFQPIAEIYGTGFYQDLEKSYESQWFLQDGRLCLAQKTYRMDSPEKFAVLVLHVSKDAVFADCGDIPYDVELRGAQLHRTELPEEDRRMEKTVAILGGAGDFTMYLDWQEEQAIAGNTLFVSGLVLLVSFLLLLTAITYFSNSFVRRIEQINQGLSRVVQENFSTTIPVDYHDELGEMTDYINEMIEETRHNIYDVYRSQLKQREYEIKALQAQISPHFLYNTLSAINWYALEAGDERISGIVISLSKFYRTALNKGESVTTIRNELENIQAYVDIQLRIHSGSFDVEYEIDDRVMEYQIPNLILQPVVENALEHGIDQKEDGRGKLSIQARDQGEHIAFEIRDNGPGMTQEIMDNLLKTKKSGYGLRNVNKRLQLFFGDNYILEIQGQDGACFRIQIPKRIELPKTEL